MKREDLLRKLTAPEIGCNSHTIEDASNAVLEEFVRVITELQAKAKDTPLGVDKQTEKTKVEKAAEAFRKGNPDKKLADNWAKGFEAFAELNPGATAEDFLGQHLGAP